MNPNEKVNKVDTGVPTDPQATPAAPSAAAQGAAANRAAGGRELDPGKSTQRGQVDYVDGLTDITDADTVVDISGILARNNRGQMKVDQMANELRNLGYNVQLTDVNGKKAIRFQNGDVFVDTSGDGQLGTEDVNFSKALSRVEGRFGVDLSSLKRTMEALDLRDRLKKQAEKMGALGQAGLLGVGEDGLREKLRKVDRDMAAAGYEGRDDAFTLWSREQLDPKLTELGLPAPDLPRPAEIAFGRGMDRVAGLATLAYDLAVALREGR
ncbi:MAG: hypothetical protein HY319_32490 [Armatimonadetes bacterium]|nr:hypothetical protein [Armatimonadota bacterium]